MPDRAQSAGSVLRRNFAMPRKRNSGRIARLHQHNAVRQTAYQKASSRRSRTLNNAALRRRVPEIVGPPTVLELHSQKRVLLNGVPAKHRHFASSAARVESEEKLLIALGRGTKRDRVRHRRRDRYGTSRDLI